MHQSIPAVSTLPPLPGWGVISGGIFLTLSVPWAGRKPTLSTPAQAFGGLVIFI